MCHQGSVVLEGPAEQKSGQFCGGQDMQSLWSVTGTHILQVNDYNNQPKNALQRPTPPSSERETPRSQPRYRKNEFTWTRAAEEHSSIESKLPRTSVKSMTARGGIEQRPPDTKARPEPMTTVRPLSCAGPPTTHQQSQRTVPPMLHKNCYACVTIQRRHAAPRREQSPNSLNPVSYTHLTLPTNREV